jgi:oxepin-CoA hydrolase/3-oxo-5,6-dehydrosuberyl-CoA semialdehyde dehydrogenase
VIGGTGDLLDRLDGQRRGHLHRLGRHRGQAARAPELVRHSIPFNAEADSLNCAILAPDVTPDDEEFDLFVKEVAREMTVKAGQKCTAIRRAIVPRRTWTPWPRRCRAPGQGGGGRPGGGGRAHGRAGLARAAGRRGRARGAAAPGAEVVLAAAPALPRWARAANGAFFPPTLLLARNPLANDAVHDVEAFGPVSTLMPYDDMDEALPWPRAARAAWWARW